MKLFSIFWDWAFSGQDILSHVELPTFWHKPSFIYLKIKKKIIVDCAEYSLLCADFL